MHAASRLSTTRSASHSFRGPCSKRVEALKTVEDRWLLISTLGSEVRQ
jgi:hypothetical protein